MKRAILLFLLWSVSGWAATTEVRQDRTTRVLVGRSTIVSSNFLGQTTQPLSQFSATTSAELAGVLSDETGSGGGFVRATSPTLTTPALGTPSAVDLANATNLPIATGVSGLGTGVATWLATPTSDNLASALTDETGSSGGFVRAGSPTFTGTVTSAGSLALGSSSLVGWNANDTYLWRRAASHVQARPSGGKISVANTDDNGSNYEWGSMGWSGNVLTIGTEKGGTGVARDVYYTHGGVTKMVVNQYGVGVGTTALSTHPFYVADSTADGAKLISIYNGNAGVNTYAGVRAQSDAGQVELRSYSAAHTTWPDSGVLTPSNLDGMFAFYSGSSTMDWLWYANGLERMRLSDNGEFRISTPGAISQSSLLVSGSPATGGTATTTKPLVLIEPTGTTSTAWITSGTMFGINAPAAFAGNLIHAAVNGAAPVFTVSAAGLVAATRITLAAGSTGAGTAPLKLTTQASVLTTPEQGTFELKGNSLKFTQLVKRRGVVMSQGVITSDTTVANTTTESGAILKAEHNANYLEAGKCEEFVIRGVISQRNNPAAFGTFRIKYAGVTIQSIVTPASTAMTSVPFELRVGFTCRTTGATGTARIDGLLMLGQSIGIDPGAGGTPTIDTTTAQDTTVTFQWNEANVANTVTFTQGRTLCIETN